MEQNRRLVDLDERVDLIRCLKEYHDANFTPGTYVHSIFGKAALLLEKTADAVEVVRCKDCKHHQWKQEPCHGRVVHSCNKLGIEVTRDFYCSYGERRNNGKKEME